MVRSHEHLGDTYRPPSSSNLVPQPQISTMFSSASAKGESPAQMGAAGSLSSVFERKTQGNVHPRFSELKKAIWKDSMTQSWAQVLDSLKEKAEQMESLGSKVGDPTKHPLGRAKGVML